MLMTTTMKTMWKEELVGALWECKLWIDNWTMRRRQPCKDSRQEHSKHTEHQVHGSWWNIYLARLIGRKKASVVKYSGKKKKVEGEAPQRGRVQKMQDLESTEFCWCLFLWLKGAIQRLKQSHITISFTLASGWMVDCSGKKQGAEKLLR